MKGRSLEELDEMFANRVSVRNFRKYQCALTLEVENDGKVGLTDDKAEAVCVENMTKETTKVVKAVE